MGNNPSRSTPQSPQVESSSSSTPTSANPHRHHASSSSGHVPLVRRDVRHKASANALVGVRKAPPVTSSTLEHATVQVSPHASTSTTAAAAAAHYAQPPGKPAPKTPPLAPQADNLDQPDHSDHPTAMGAEHSKEKDSRSAKKQQRESQQPSPTVQPPAHHLPYVPVTAPPAITSPQARPVDVPKQQTSDDQSFSAIDSNVSSEPRYHLPPSQLIRPPRLPLPIEEEVYTPGSPILSPADLDSPDVFDGRDGELPRPGSVLSSTTQDDDDEGGDVNELQQVEGAFPPVPTIVEWTEPGEKVYVTGTFTRWERKYRLHRK
ncbi:carbohydrate-binding module family 48 protein [Aulographum hederae CBS 113979]|uniref:Carbohydrate-binding module family 48 protein n=1 Tax=Aulographum hederae CBS 113979 TaxID=1176131 RepID=A0A6G1GRF3_9PEZI|nr:carbohydrate-binding module family 48 protein [Aulographum hederae CBS 113979]